jgi:hypothetical protein
MAKTPRPRALTPEQFRARNQAIATFWQGQASNDPTNGGIDPERAFDCYPHPEIGPEHLGSDTLLAYPEDLEHQTRHLPALALRAMSCVLSSLDQARMDARNAGASSNGNYAALDVEALAGFMTLVQHQLEIPLYSAENVAIARAALNKAQGETNAH